MEQLSKQVRSLAEQECLTDVAFDAMLSEKAIRLSRRHWTPVPIARRAAELLVGDGNAASVLDVGSGVGKFCLVGALMTKASFFGVEQREDLCWEGKRLARALELSQVRFTCKNMAVIDWDRFDAIYLYNPFYENLESEARMDERVEVTQEFYDRYVMIVEDKLARARVGTRVATYHGFGGVFPKGYSQILKEPWHDDFLELWVKQERTPGTGLPSIELLLTGAGK